MAHSPRAPTQSQWQLAYLACDDLSKIAHLDDPAQILIAKVNMKKPTSEAA
jgi:hypothetical protein